MVVSSRLTQLNRYVFGITLSGNRNQAIWHEVRLQLIKAFVIQFPEFRPLNNGIVVSNNGSIVVSLLANDARRVVVAFYVDACRFLFAFGFGRRRVRGC